MKDTVSTTVVMADAIIDMDGMKWKTAFPILTLVTNLIGAVLIGFIVGIVSSKQDVSANSVLFWKTGVCGGFTTFSTFSLETFTLFENKAYVSGGIYVALSILGCIAGVFIGKKLARVA